jgi:SAM-dependent methyltransferase
MPFENDSIDYFLMIDVFHHVPDSRKFLSELDRCLKRNGKVVMIEPANTFWGSFIYRNFHHELFDPAGGWSLPKEAPLSSANAALPWIVFCRDREIFRKEFLRLKIMELKAHTPLKYLLSGGVSMPQLVPSFSYSALSAFEWLLSPLHPMIGMYYTVVLSKEFDEDVRLDDKHKPN